MCTLEARTAGPSRLAARNESAVSLMAERPERAASVRALAHSECAAVLARNHVGRVGYVVNARVEIQPINYAYEAGWIYGRTSEGSKLRALQQEHWVAFEVDEVRGAFDWVSVIVHGTFHRLDPDATHHDEAAAARAIALLRAVVPETFTAADPAPARSVIFRISIGEMTGRSATPPS